MHCANVRVRYGGIHRSSTVYKGHVQSFDLVNAFHAVVDFHFSKQRSEKSGEVLVIYTFLQSYCQLIG